MKKILVIIGALLITSSSVNAGDWFGAGWKPKPSLTLFGQKLTWPLPSLCLGAKAGVLPDAGISPKGINLKIPYFALDVPFPSLTLKVGDKSAELKLGSIDKSSHKPKE